MSESSSASIYSEDVVLGLWQDHGRSSFFQTRLTLTSNASNLLLIALAVLTTVTGEYVWQIFCQLLFLRRASDRPQDGLFHQIQVSLRNDDSPGEFSWNTFRLSMAWGKRRNAFRWRALRWSLFGLLMLCVSNTSSFWLPVLSSEGQVLLQAPHWVNNFTLSDAVYANDSAKHKAYQNAIGTEDELRAGAQTESFAAYARSCYPSLSADAAFYSGGTRMCDLYARRTLNYTASFPGECPFARDLCSVPPDQIIRVDSGKINSHDDLGINTARDSRIEFQTTLTCSPVRTEGYVSPNYTSIANMSDSLIFYYGPNALATFDFLTNPNHDFNFDVASNITYYFPKTAADSRYPLLSIRAASEDTMLTAGKKLYSSFNLSSGLREVDGAVTLLFLTNHLVTLDPVNDPWFNMSKAVTIPADDYGAPIVYVAPNQVSVLGCLQTWVFCNPSNQKCVNADKIQPKKSGGNNDALWDSLGLTTKHHRELAEFMIFETRAAALGEYMWDKDRALLLSDMFRVGADAYAHLSDNHWQTEVKYWMTMLLARMQGNVMTLVERPLSELVNSGSISPPDPNNDWMYDLRHRLKVRSHSHQSFSAAAIALLVVIQTSIILTGLYMQFIWPWLRLRRLNDNPNQFRRYKMWQLMGAIQLHRCLHQLLGRGRWRGAWHEIPTTDPKGTFCEYGKLPWQPYVTLEQERERAAIARPYTFDERLYTCDDEKEETSQQGEDSDIKTPVQTLSK